jgi:hypothetical protein
MPRKEQEKILQIQPLGHGGEYDPLGTGAGLGRTFVDLSIQSMQSQNSLERKAEDP